MQIDFNLKDEFIPQIKDETKLAGISTKNDYRVYGNLFCKGDGRPVVRIDAPENLISEQLEDEITEFFAANGIPIGFYNDANIKHPNKIYIGLRGDIRPNIILCSGIVNTLVHVIEGKTQLDKNFKIKNVPVWAEPTEEEPKKEEKPKKN